jgi:hypothetical protein
MNLCLQPFPLLVLFCVVWTTVGYAARWVQDVLTARSRRLPPQPRDANGRFVRRT